MSRLLLIRRARRFSTADADTDAAVLERIAHSAQCPLPCDMIDEDEVSEKHLPHTLSSFTHVLSMARGDGCLTVSAQWQAQGVNVINAPEAVKNCQRGKLNALLLVEGMIPPCHTAKHGFWVKPADGRGLHAGGAIYCRSMTEAMAMQRHFVDKGMDDTVVTAHIEGEIVKFYGVTDMPCRVSGADESHPIDFFHTYTADKQARSLPSRLHGTLQSTAMRLAHRLSLSVFGGDAVIQDNGQVAIIDINDWPSFSPCVAEAAVAIMSLLKVRESFGDRHTHYASTTYPPLV